MTTSSLVKLIHSLSSSEKRFFKLQCKMQAGSKEYELLFDLLEKNKSLTSAELRESYKKKSPEGSWENTCTYLGNMLLESLVRAKKEKDIFFELMEKIQQVHVLAERSLDEEAFKLIRKVREKAIKYQLHWIEYYCHRYELNYYADNNFPGLKDDSLIKLQMKGKEVLKSLNSIHDHYSLYELLKYRLIHAGKVVSAEGRKKLNDLMLSEMVLITGKSKSFSSQKLHLLFQSFFFTHIGEYQSAAKSFYQLNELLEKNSTLIDNPPLDYLSALNGIMDSLRMLKNDTEVSYYLEKIRQLDQSFYPEFFRYMVRKTFCTQQIITFLQSGQLDEAREFVKEIPKDVFDDYAMVDEEKQSELYFYCSLVYFLKSDWRKAHLFLREVMNELKLPEQSLVSKAIRLLNIIIYFEKKEYLHLEYEIRSYKRHFLQSKLLRTEKILFKVIGSSKANNRFRLTENDRKKISRELNEAMNDRYEQELLKYFDFAEWTMSAIHPHSSGALPPTSS